MGSVSSTAQYPRIAKVGMAMLGLLALITGLLAWRDYHSDVDRSGDRLAGLAETESRNLERYVQARFQILGTLASGADFRGGDVRAIGRDLFAVDPPERGFDGGMMWIDRTGRVRASTVNGGQGVGIDLSDRRYVKDVLRTGRQSVQAVIGRVNDLPVVVLAVATHDGTGQVNGAVLGVFRQQAIAAQMTGFTGGTEDVVIIDDVANIVVGGRPGVLDRIDPASPYGVIRYRQKGVISSAAGLTGRRDQVIGFSLVPSLDWIVAVSDDRGEVLRPLRRSFAQKLLIVMGFVTLALAGMLWELRRARRIRKMADDRRLASTRQRIAASRFIVADNPGTVARTVCHAIEDELAIPWCAIVSAMPGAPTRVLATSGEAPAWLGRIEVDLELLPAVARAEAVRLVPLRIDGTDGDDHEVRAARIGAASAAGTRVLVTPYGDDLDEAQRGSVSGILESATQAFDRAYLMDRDRRATELANLLARITSELSVVEGAEARTRRLLEVVVPEWADAAVVQTVTPPFDTLAARHRIPGRLPIVIAAARDGLRDALRIEDRSATVRSTPTGSESLVGAMRSGATALVTVDGATVISVPLSLDTEAETVLVAWREAGRPPFDEDNIGFAELVADRAGIAITRARRVAQERRVALELQRSLLPESRAEFSDRVRVASRYLPGSREMSVGGDWFDASERRDGRLALVVGDVVGHGLESAAAMGRLASALRALAITEETTESMLDGLGDFAARTRGAMLATVALLILDAATGEIEYSVAGHPPPLVVHADGSTDYLWDGRRTPLGVTLADPEGVRGLASVSEGDTIILYTDGVVERRGEIIDTSLDRLARTARANRDLSPESMVDAVLGEMLDAVHQSDDAAMLVARVDHIGRRLRFSVAPTPAALAGARRRVDGWTAGMSSSEPAETVGIAVGIAMSNLARCSGDDDQIALELSESRDGEYAIRLTREGADVAGVFVDGAPALDAIRGLVAESRVDRRGDGVTIELRGRVARVATVA